MLFAALIFAASTEPCTIRPLGWSCSAERILQRPEDERQLIYMILEVEASKDAKRLAVNTPSERCWTAKVAGFEYAMLSMAASPGSKMYSYYSRVSMAYQARIEGNLDDHSLVAVLKTISRPVAAPPTEAAMRSALDGELSDLIEGAADALIANAKQAATSFEGDCVI